MPRRKPPIYSEDIDGLRCEVRTTRDEYEVTVIKDGEIVGEWAFPKLQRTVTVDICRMWSRQAVTNTKREQASQVKQPA